MSGPFVGRRVKITGTSKADLNGQTGVAQSYSPSTMRYTVLLSSGTSVALKPANLLPDGSEDEGGGGFPAGGMPDMNQVLHMLPSWLREKLARGQTPDMNDLQRLLPPGVTLVHAGGGLAVFVVLAFKVGLLRALLLCGLLGFLVTIFDITAYSRAGGGISGLMAAAEAAGQQVSHRVGTMSQQQLKLSPMMSLGALAAVVLAVFYFVLVSGSSGSASFSSGEPSYGSYTPPRHFSPSMTLEQAYDLGYADGASGEGRNWAGHEAATPSADNADYYPEYPPSPPLQRSDGGISNFFSFGKLFTLALLGKQMHGLGAAPGGGWSYHLAMANLANQSAVQKGFLALMVLRLFGMSPI
mmetsp:Transcript_20188/g.34052  ORF Transcript_20188/g.34052 Transcript_20188/m.34052 type:complete len:355 (+) Transcript_20188:34-1098(+)